MKKTIAFAILSTFMFLAGCGANSVEITEPIREAVETTEPILEAEKTTEPIREAVETTEPIWEAEETTEPIGETMETTEPIEPVDHYISDPNADAEYFFPISTSLEFLEIQVGDNTHIFSTDKNSAIFCPNSPKKLDYLPMEFQNCSFVYYPIGLSSSHLMDFNTHSEHKISRLELYIKNDAMETPVEQYWTRASMVACINYTTPTSTVSIPHMVYDTINKKYHVITGAHIIFENGDIIYAFSDCCGI